MNDQARWMARRAGQARPRGLDRNPLRRRMDRAETCITAGLVAVFLAAAPLIAVTAGGWVHAAGLREQHAPTRRSITHGPRKRNVRRGHHGPAAPGSRATTRAGPVRAAQVRPRCLPTCR